MLKWSELIYRWKNHRRAFIDMINEELKEANIFNTREACFNEVRSFWVNLMLLLMRLYVQFMKVAVLTLKKNNNVVEHLI